MTLHGRRSVEVAIVGGGLAGSTLAARLASQGVDVVVIERSPSWRWTAGGVFASPASVAELRDVGLPEDELQAVARPIPAMRVETAAQTVFRLTYGGAGAVGFDRSRLDPSVLALAERRGAEILRDRTAVAVEPGAGGRPGRIVVRGPAGEEEIAAQVIVGADGIRSIVARRVGVARAAALGTRIGMSWHVRDGRGDGPLGARMVVLDGAYCGLAPVPGDRLNIGIVLAGGRWRSRLRADGAAAVGQAIIDAVPPAGEPESERWREGPALDGIVGAYPLGHRVTRTAGPGWLLVGDAAGFLDPFTGEGIHRALVSARLAADALARRPQHGSPDLAPYQRAMQSRFRTKDVVSMVVQGFLARPMLFEYAARRLASRDRLRETMGLVIGDLAPASRALDPRYLAALLAP
jgi:flavin-dependent dehydrogenase